MINGMSHRIALLGLYHESNTFIHTPTTLADFRHGHWLFGEAIRREYREAYHEIGGMLEVLEQEGVEVVPVMYAEATPGGIVAEEAYATLCRDMMDALERVLPVDGCLVAPHGAGVSAAHRDMDGHWLTRLRGRVGDIPIIGTLDPHANVSEQMVAATDALVMYRTNPHVDQRSRGAEAATLMVRTLRGQIRPRQLLRPLPLAISIEQQHTGEEPCLSLYHRAEAMEQERDILAVSIGLGFPYADVPEMGSSVLVVSDNNLPAAEAVAARLEAYVRKDHKRFNGPRITVDEALSSLGEYPGPVLLLDMGDNVGGGSPGNSLVLLRALESSGQYRSFFCSWDPEAVGQTAGASIGQVLDLRLRDSQGFYPLKATLLHRGSGHFRETDPRHGGQVHYDMGDIAVVSTARGNVIMLTSLRVPPFSLRQLTSFGIAPEAFDVLVAKGVNAPIAAYGPVCASILKVHTPGVTQADMTQFEYRHRRRPLYPFEAL